jgi:hypothetical protein
LRCGIPLVTNDQEGAKPMSSDDKHDKDKPGGGDSGGGGGPKPVTIYVNTKPHTVAKDEISYEEVTKLAFPSTVLGPDEGFSVMYQRAHGNHDGSLVPGQSVKVKEGMIFDVTPTHLS